MVFFFLGGLVGPEAAFGEVRAEPVEACSVLTREEIQEVLGVEPDRGTRTSVGPAVSVCRWTAADGDEDLLYVILAPRTVASEAELRARLVRVLGTPKDFRSVPGIGDFAVWVSLVGEPAALQVYWQEYLLQVGIESNPPDRVAAARSLAVFALARLSTIDARSTSAPGRIVPPPGKADGNGPPTRRGHLVAVGRGSEVIPNSAEDLAVAGILADQGASSTPDSHDPQA